MENTKIKGVIFDYGGTIDSRGVHWSEVIWDAYRDADVPVTKEQFRECYVFAERELAKVRHILPHHNFYDLLLIKMRIEIAYLVDNKMLPADYPVEEKALHTALYCYNRAKESIAEARSTLDFIHERLPMVLVSNFYGNIHQVLNEFDLDGLFDSIIESAVVGVRKPDPAIFTLGVNALGMAAEDTVVVGDSYTKDIVPAHAAGCHTVWFKGEAWTEEIFDESIPDRIITDLSDLL